ncbi:MAG: HAD-IA family hydrolase [Acidobacteriota bacterium]
MRFDLVIFDLDGTLVDSVEDLRQSVNHTMLLVGFQPVSRAQLCDFVGDGARILVTRCLAATPGRGPLDEGLVDGAFRHFIAHYSAHLLDHTRLYPGVAETLPELARRSRLCVLSNKSEGFSRRTVEGLGVSQYFGKIFGGDSFPVRKPDPAGFVEIMRRLAAHPAGCLVVGDSRNDIAGGRAAGARTCGVLYGIKPLEVRPSGPDYVVDAFPNLLDIIEG